MLTKRPAKKRLASSNHAVWLGPLITASGAISYFTFFARFPALRDFPWVNLPFVLGGVVLSWLGWQRAFARAARWSSKLVAAAALVGSTAIASLFCAYVFIISTWLPQPTTAGAIGELAPSFRLTDHLGREVALEDFRDRKLVVVFYRGFW